MCDAFDGETTCAPVGPATPPARRVYRGLELMAKKTYGDRLWIQASYVYSSLRGNYDGGVNQSAYGQTAVGKNIDFDYPAWHTELDNLERVGARSLQIVGDVLLSALPDIEKRIQR